MAERAEAAGLHLEHEVAAGLGRGRGGQQGQGKQGPQQPPPRKRAGASLFYRPMIELAVYVSGHGFGHATRTAEALRAVRALRPSTSIAVTKYSPS